MSKRTSTEKSSCAKKPKSAAAQTKTFFYVEDFEPSRLSFGIVAHGQANSKFIPFRYSYPQADGSNITEKLNARIRGNENVISNLGLRKNTGKEQAIKIFPGFSFGVEICSADGKTCKETLALKNFLEIFHATVAKMAFDGNHAPGRTVDDVARLIEDPQVPPGSKEDKTRKDYTSLKRTCYSNMIVYPSNQVAINDWLSTNSRSSPEEKELKIKELVESKYYVQKEKFNNNGEKICKSVSPILFNLNSNIGRCEVVMLTLTGSLLLSKACNKIMFSHAVVVYVPRPESDNGPGEGFAVEDDSDDDDNDDDGGTTKQQIDGNDGEYAWMDKKNSASAVLE